MNLILYLLCRLAGIRKDALSRAPQAWDQAATVGVIMLLTATIASIAMGYAIARTFEGESYARNAAIVGGILWGTFVLFVDRLILITMEKLAPKMSVGAQVLPWVQAIPRFAFAIVIGLSVSTPVTLRISQTILDRELYAERRMVAAQEAAENAQRERLADKSATVEKLESAYSAQQDRVQSEPASFDYLTAVDELRGAELRRDNVTATNGRRIASARLTLRRLAGSTVAEDVEREAGLRSSIATWQREIAAANGRVNQAKEAVQAARREWVRDQEAKLATIDAELKNATSVAAESEQRVADANAESDATLKSLMRPNLINEYTRLKRIQNDPSHPDSATLRIFALAMHILFILVEMMPILAKLLSRSTPLDDAMLAMEDEERELINLATSSAIVRAQKEAEAALEVHEQALEKWRNEQLKRIKRARITPTTLRQLRKQFEEAAAFGPVPAANNNGHDNSQAGKETTQ